MTDRPILFSAPMVRALLDGRKSQTRRILKPQPTQGYAGETPYFTWGKVTGLWPDDWQYAMERNVRVSVGDRLWVREAWRCNGWATDVATIFYAASEGGGYTAMCEQYPVAGKLPLRITHGWRPSIHMPRWASRITLIVTDVRVERLQDISPEDARDEGVERRSRKVRQMWLFGASAEERAAMYLRACVWEYEDLWNEINGPGAWEANPWVVAYSFRTILQNIDQIERAAA